MYSVQVSHTHAHTTLPVQKKDMSIIHISLPELFDKLSGHHTQTKHIDLVKA